VSPQTLTRIENSAMESCGDKLQFTIWSGALFPPNFVTFRLLDFRLLWVGRDFWHILDGGSTEKMAFFVSFSVFAVVDKKVQERTKKAERPFMFTLSKCRPDSMRGCQRLFPRNKWHRAKFPHEILLSSMLYKARLYLGIFVLLLQKVLFFSV
jgi:hypothetical protein